MEASERLGRYTIRVAGAEVDEGLVACSRESSLQQMTRAQRAHHWIQDRVVLKYGTPLVVAMRNHLQSTPMGNEQRDFKWAHLGHPLPVSPKELE